LTSRANNEKKNYTDFLLNDAEYEAIIDYAKAIVKQFMELIKKGKYIKALELYLKEQQSFFVAFELSTDNFEFHSDIIIPLLFKYKDVSFAYEKAIAILKMEQTLAESDIVFSNGNNIPAHYGHLISELERLYTQTGRYEDAIAASDKLLNVTKQKDVHVTVYYNRACIYLLMDNNKSALKSAQKVISILKKHKLQDDAIYSNCQMIIEATKGNSKKHASNTINFRL